MKGRIGSDEQPNGPSKLVTVVCVLGLRGQGVPSVYWIGVDEVKGVGDEMVDRYDEEEGYHNSGATGWPGWQLHGWCHRQRLSGVLSGSSPKCAIVRVGLGWSRRSKVQ